MKPEEAQNELLRILPGLVALISPSLSDIGGGKVSVVVELTPEPGRAIGAVCGMNAHVESSAEYKRRAVETIERERDSN